MREARGRFDITVIDGKVYAVGGCNGTTELATAEVYSSDNAKWTALPPLESARSNIGVSSKIDLYKYQCQQFALFLYRRCL
jgi:influenza virus NS1A-binding protein